MDQVTLVNRQINEGQALLENLSLMGYDVSAALWLRPADDSWWRLYIASKSVEVYGPTAAYQALQQGLFPGICISLADITLIGATDPIAMDVRKLQRKTPGQESIHFRGSRLGHMAIEEAYIYPPLASPERKSESMPSKEIIDKVIAHMDTHDGAQSCTITLTDGTTFSGIPFGLEISNQGMAAKFIEQASRLPRIVTIAEIQAIR